MGGSSRSGSKGKSGGQRGNIGSASGQKQHSPTSNSHKGSRVEPSHTSEHARTVREQKTATRGTKKAGNTKV